MNWTIFEIWKSSFIVGWLSVACGGKRTERWSALLLSRLCGDWEASICLSVWWFLTVYTWGICSHTHTHPGSWGSCEQTLSQKDCNLSCRHRGKYTSNTWGMTWSEDQGYYSFEKFILILFDKKILCGLTVNNSLKVIPKRKKILNIFSQM